MLLSQVMRRAAITGRTDAVGARLLGRQGGRWTQQWIDGAFPAAAARTHHAPAPAPSPEDRARIALLEDLRRRGVLTEDEVERLRAPRGS
jgi:hypothetical protein